MSATTRRELADASPARLYATLVGGALAVGGILGFFFSGSFGTPGDVSNALGVLAVNGWHNLAHLATGLLGLALARRAAREYALGLGLAYAVLALWGFVLGAGHSLAGLVPVNSADNVLHLALGLLGLGAGAATQPADTAPLRSRPAAAAAPQLRSTPAASPRARRDD